MSRLRSQGSRSLRRSLVLASAGLCAAALLGACKLTERAPAALDVPQAYRNAPRHADRALPAVDWWRGFRSRQLTNLVEEAMTSNLDIAAAVARIVQADAQARIAGSALLPIVEADGSASRTRSAGSTVGGRVTPASYRTTYTVSLGASYEIDFWGKNRAALRSAEQIAASSRFAREVVALSIAAAVANAYFQILAAQDRLRVAQQNLQAATRVFNLIKERFDAGTASALDTAQQESIVAQQRAAIPSLERTVRENMATLAVLIGRAPAHVRIRGGSMNAVAIPPVTPGLPSDLIAQRPDIRDAEAQLAAVDADVESARAAMFPSVVLTGEGGFTSAALRALFRPESAFFSLASGVTQPIFDGLRLQGQLDFQKGRQDELLQLYRLAVVNGFADVERALVAVQQTARREALQRQVVASSRRAFDIAETRLREGAVDLVTVLNTQQSLFQAQDQLALARLDRLLAVVSLFQALGGGWPLTREELRQAAASQAR